MTSSTAQRPGDNGIAYINGRIFSVNSHQPWAEAFIVSPIGIFTTVGSNDEIKAKAKQAGLITCDLQNRFIMPGLHDAHVHMLFSGIALTSHIRLPGQGLTNENLSEELRKGSCACKFANVNEDWLVAHGYLIDDFDRRILDRQYPDRPVMIRGGAGHSAFLNSAALERAGYDIKGEPDGQGTCYKRDVNGHLTGEMAENGMSKAMTSLPQPGPSHVRRVLLAAQQKLHAAGVTSCQEASANSLLLKGLQGLESADLLKLEIFPHIVYAPDWIGEESSESLHALLDRAEAFKSPHVDTRFVKIILDGVPLAPYWSHAALKPDDGTVDESKLLILNVSEAIRKYDERDMTMKIHCTGTGATRVVLDAYAAARQSNPNGPRHEIAHCSGVHADDYERFHALKVTAEMSPAFFFTHPITAGSGGLMNWEFAKMLAHNAHVTVGSDWGAGEEPDMLPFLDGIVEVLGGGDRQAEGEALCRMLTLAGAEAVGRQKDLGSIEVGKKANFIAVDRDLSRGEFDGASVLTTWFEGEIMYEKP
jgi:predicted amidohydrolase YtcJ